MDPRQELFAVDQRQVLEFFFVGLQDVSEPNVERQELLYNASVLAHYAQVSTQSVDDWPAPLTLATIFDYFVMDRSLHDDGQMMETAGAQCLLLSGFFEDQMRHRHNIAWYSRLGSGFFRRAAARAGATRKAKLLAALARTFETWRQRHARLARELRTQRYLLDPLAPRPAA